jgi:REP element-mobilizing transposase RayT
MPLYRRRLPHWQPKNKPLFLTWSLAGSLPENRYPPPHADSAGKAFVWMDRCLDEARSGPTWLVRPEIAKIVTDALHYGAEQLHHYDLYAWVVMANHVHVLIQPYVAASVLLKSIKNFTAREANKLISRTGHPFWQSESYDHWVRDEKEFENIRRYIENNPVRAGLVASPEMYAFSSARETL